eukprot:g3083.t1
MTHAFGPVPPHADAGRARGGNLWARDCPLYVVDLDAPAGDRWETIVKDFAEHLPSVAKLAEDILGDGVISSLTTGVFAMATRLGRVYFAEELEGIANATGLPLGRVVLLQIAYEAFAACTSIVVDGQDGHPLHMRTMDWEMPELQQLTIQVDFVSGGQTVFRATTWAGYVGVLTGMRPQGYSVSVNYRRTELGASDGVGGIFRNMQRGAAGHWPVSFLVREVLETENSFHSACDAFRMSELMAPVYLTIAGVRPGEGLVLARDRKPTDGYASVSEMLGHGSRTAGSDDGVCHSVVQTNMDIWRCDADRSEDDWQDICESRVRRRFAKAALHSIASASEGVTMEDLWCLVSIPPCKAPDTVYTTAMVPATGELVTRVSVTAAQARVARRRTRESHS